MLLGASASPSFAQELGLDVNTEPPASPMPGSLGFKIGNNSQSRLHPYLSVDIHWLSNPGRLAPPSPSDLVLSSRLGFDVNRCSAHLQLRGDAALAYNRFLGIQSTTTQALSNVSGHVDMHQWINKEKPYRWRLHQQLLRSADPSNQSATERLMHTSLQTTAAWDGQPPGSSILMTFGSSFAYDFYDNNQPDIFNGILNNGRLTPWLRAAWLWLPKTAFFGEITHQTTFFSRLYEPPMALINKNSMATTGSLGVIGNMTAKTSGLIKIGYGYFLPWPNSAFHQAVVGEWTVSYRPTTTAKFDLSLNRSLQPTSLFVCYTLNQLSTRYDQQLGSKGVISIRLQAANYRFGLPLQPPVGERLDWEIGADLLFKQALTPWLSVAAVERFIRRYSNWQTALGNAGYVFNDAMMQVELRY